MTIPQHIIDLLEDYQDGSLDDAGREALQSWVGQCEQHSHAMAQWFMREVELFEASRISDMCAVFEGASFDSQYRSLKPATVVPPRKFWNTRMGVMAVAATLIFALAGSYLMRWPNQNPRDGAALANSEADSSTDELPPAPAILGRLAKCVWAPGMHPLRVGQNIAAGTTIDIRSGLAQLHFESGAKVVLKGPCRMRVDSAMLCWLSSGDVSAEVPPRAAGFTIRGPSSEVIDLGTRFGFSVGDNGKSEVHVFQGEVVSRRLNERGEIVGSDFVLKENQAILFPGQQQQAQRLAADEAKFALEVRPLWLRDNIEPLLIDRNVALWLRAEHGVQKGTKGKVIAWQDLAHGDNQIANDAFQPRAKARPVFVVDALGGRPAIRFDGKGTFLTTTPMTTTDNQTIVVVFQHATPISQGKREGGQIINYNGPPSRYLPDFHSPGVLQLGEKIGDWEGPLLSIAAKAFVGRSSHGDDVSAGVVRSESLTSDVPHVAAYIYDNAHNRATLYIDGRPVANASAPTRVAVTSRKVIGKHGIFNQWYFHGDLGELIIYNAALSPPEVEQLSKQLMAHYGQAQPLKEAL